MTTPLSLSAELSMEDMEQLGPPPDEAAEKKTEVPAAVVAAPDPQLEAYKEALRISESARLAAQAQAPTPVVVQTQRQEAPKWFSDDELKEMLNSDDANQRFQAVQLSNRQAIAQVANHYEQNMAHLQNSIVSAAESAARSKYPTEFALFGDQINNYLSQPGFRPQLTSILNWDKFIAVVRGEEGNLEKLIDARAGARQQAAAQTATTARAAQQAAAGVQFQPANGNGSPAFVVDDITRRIAADLNYPSVEAYLKDMKLLDELGGVQLNA